MDCCQSKSKSKKCVRKKDGQEFKLPRKFSKEACLNKPIKGFSMRSSCAPYLYCKKRKLTKKHKLARKKKTTKKGGGKKNILGKKLKICSLEPLTGYYRDGYCDSGPDDLGKHLVCGRMTTEFLNFTKKQGNDLSSVVKEGEKWCLCEERWLEAYKNGIKVPVIKNSTSQKVKKSIRQKILKGKKVKNFKR